MQRLDASVLAFAMISAFRNSQLYMQLEVCSILYTLYVYLSYINVDFYDLVIPNHSISNQRLFKLSKLNVIFLSSTILCPVSTQVHLTILFYAFSLCNKYNVFQWTRMCKNIWKSKYKISMCKLYLNIEFLIQTSNMCFLGAHLICYPGAFNMTTGPLHWELLQRARY